MGHVNYSISVGVGNAIIVAHDVTAEDIPEVLAGLLSISVEPIEEEKSDEDLVSNDFTDDDQEYEEPELSPNLGPICDMIGFIRSRRKRARNRA